MPEIKKDNQPEYLSCTTCDGRGFSADHICPACHGDGTGINLNGKILLWRRELSQMAISRRRLERSIDVFINVMLMVFGIGGFLLFAWYGYRNFGSTSSILGLVNLILVRNDSLLVFWLSLLTDLYLYYRLNRANEKREKVMAKKVSVDQPEVLASWPDMRTLKNRKLDVAGAYSDIALKTIDESYLLAERMGHAEVQPIHLLAEILSTYKIKVLFSRLGIDASQMVVRLRSALKNLPTGRKTKISLPVKKILLQAYYQAYDSKKLNVEVTDLIWSICSIDEIVSEIFYDLNVDLDKLSNVIFWLDFQQVLSAQYYRFRSLAHYKPKGDMDRAMTALATPLLNSCGSNMTAAAALGYYYPCLGREKEMESIFQTLESVGHGNVILVGESGVGKTSIIEGIAQLMAAEEVPEIMQDKRLVNLNVAMLIGGSSPDRAQARFIEVIREVIDAGNVCLVIENIHELIGITTGAQESLDLSGILTKMLANGSFLCIATSSRENYLRYIERNSSFGTVFSKVNVEEMETKDAIRVLESRVGSIEYKHKVFVAYDAIDKAVDLSSRLIHDERLPAKALKIIEQTAIMVQRRKGDTFVSGNDVAEVITQLTNIPVAEITSDESQKLLTMEAKIHERIVGQDEAVKMASSALRRARANLRSTKKPIANLLFLGPTGVGKTELTKTITDVYFGNEERMIRLDMSEYQDTGSIYRLIGEPNGQEGGFFTEAVRKNPFSLILLDEIEKANANILNLFLQVLDDGRLTDSLGRVIDFTNAIIVATSNAGTEFIQDRIKAGDDLATIKEGLISTQLRNYFRPEFLNRFDGIIVFRPLVMSEVEQIARLMIKKTAIELEAKGVILEVDDDYLKELAVAGFDPTLGARPLRRVIQERLDDALANLVLGGQLGRRDRVIFHAGGQFEVVKAKSF